MPSHPMCTHHFQPSAVPCLWPRFTLQVSGVSTTHSVAQPETQMSSICDSLLPPLSNLPH